MKNNYELPEPFKTAFNLGDASIDYRLVKGVSKTDHQLVRELGYKVERHSDCSYDAVGLEGLSLSSYGDWGTIFLNWANDKSKELFLKMCAEGIIEPWRIREYTKNTCFDYNSGKWLTYDKINEEWVETKCPYNENALHN